VLEAGAAVLEESGYDGFTIAAVCERAGVAVATIYARVASKDALFLAVYDNVLAAIDAGDRALDGPEHWDGLPLRQVIGDAVALVAAQFLDHAAFMRVVILLSGSHEEVRRRGSIWTTALGRRFTAVLMRRADGIPRTDVPLAVDTCYRMVFSSVAIHVAYGAGFESERSLTDEQFLHELLEVAERYLLGTD
jgi:AcrR family transcriptional regulator